jgi:hypothetical protein
MALSGLLKSTSLPGSPSERVHCSRPCSASFGDPSNNLLVNRTIDELSGSTVLYPHAGQQTNWQPLFSGQDWQAICSAGLNR